MKNEKPKLGNVKIINLDDELELEELNLTNPDEELYAYARYGTTSGCSDSCGSSTGCC